MHASKFEHSRHLSFPNGLATSTHLASVFLPPFEPVRTRRQILLHSRRLDPTPSFLRFRAREEARSSSPLSSLLSLLQVITNDLCRRLRQRAFAEPNVRHAHRHQAHSCHLHDISRATSTALCVSWHSGRLYSSGYVLRLSRREVSLAVLPFQRRRRIPSVLS